jgi:O-antigen/teichoic acid export membrane protein
MMGFFCVADTFVSVILTDKWMPATIYIRIFALNYLLNFVQMGNLQAIKAIGRSDIIFKLECIKKTIYTIVLFVFILFAKSPVVIALAAVVNVVIATLINTRPNRRLIGYFYKDQLRDVLPNFVLSLMMGAVVSLLGFLPIAKPLLLIVQVFGGAVTYGALALLFKNESFFYIFDLVKVGLKRETH